MDHIGRRLAVPLLTFLLNAGLTVSGFVNATVAFSLWALMIPTALYAVWPWIKRVRVGLTPADAEVRQLEENIREIEQMRDALRAENEELISGMSPNGNQEVVRGFIEEYAGGLERLPAPQSLPPDAGSRQSFDGLSFRLTDLVRGDLMRGKTFHNCTIHGPAVIYYKGKVKVLNCTYDSRLDSLYWEVPEGGYRNGIIAIENCVFIECTFIRIGLAGTPRQIEKYNASFMEKAADGQSETPTNQQ